jgi:hypothetical protein
MNPVFPESNILSPCRNSNEYNSNTGGDWKSKVQVSESNTSAADIFAAGCRVPTEKILQNFLNQETGQKRSVIELQSKIFVKFTNNPP